MRSKPWLIIAVWCVLAFRPANVHGDTLKILTINVWSGLDYNGSFKMGEYESSRERLDRFRSLVTQTKELSPDLIFVQEANPVAGYAADLATALSMVEIHQVVNGGLKVGPLGIPTNLKEGLVILAKPDLSLQKVGAWKLSGSLGIHSDILSFHLSEVVLALAGTITKGGREIFLVNVHLVAAPTHPVDLDSFRESVLSEGELDETDLSMAMLRWEERERQRTREVEKLLSRLKLLPPDVPCIVAGDFNAEPDSAEIKLFEDKGGYRDVMKVRSVMGIVDTDLFTWNVDRNENTSFSGRKTDARGKTRVGYDYLSAVADARNRRLDYIFLGKELDKAQILTTRIVLNEKNEGVQPSDHFGVLADIAIH